MNGARFGAGSGRIPPSLNRMNPTRTSGMLLSGEPLGSGSFRGPGPDWLLELDQNQILTFISVSSRFLQTCFLSAELRSDFLIRTRYLLKKSG